MNRHAGRSPKDSAHPPARWRWAFCLGLIALLLVARAGGVARGQGDPKPLSATSTTNGVAEAINAFRVANGLSAIPVSAALTKVAQAHIHDLMANHPEHVQGCNMHSWSTDGAWITAAAPGAKGGCFSGKFTDAESQMTWNKPKEIAGYPGYGYENAYFSSGPVTAVDAVLAWTRQGDPHRDVILNVGIWAPLHWKAVGGWMEDGYAVVWFGEQDDLSDTPTVLPAATPTDMGDQLPTDTPADANGQDATAAATDTVDQFATETPVDTSGQDATETPTDMGDQVPTDTPVDAGNQSAPDMPGNASGQDPNGQDAMETPSP